jgi:hypothetical protein
VSIARVTTSCATLAFLVYPLNPLDMLVVVCIEPDIAFGYFGDHLLSPVLTVFNMAWDIMGVKGNKIGTYHIIITSYHESVIEG